MSELAPEGLDDARARVHREAAESRARNEALRALADSVEAAIGMARSPDGSMEVTASTSGAVTRIVLTAHALDASPEAVAADLMSVIAAAQRVALVRAQQLSAEQLGETHPLVQELEQSQTRFASPDGGLGYR
jgi:hypothetical protein